MAVIYLKHPTHGAKVATSVWEADYDKEHGWIEFDPSVPSLAVPEDQEPVNSLLTEPRRRGRPRKE